MNSTDSFGIDRELLVTVLLGNASEVEHRLVRAWRDAHPSNEREWVRIERLWTTVGELEPPPGDEHAGSVDHPSPETIIALAEGGSGAYPGTRPHRRFLVGASIAAALVVGLGLGALAATLSTPVAFGPRLVTTGANEVATIRLPDQTVVRVGPDSRLEFGEGPRSVRLVGRAYFAVANQEGAPFRVHLPERVLTVLGTRFDVEERGGQTRVAVVEGQVRISADGEGATAGPGEVAVGRQPGSLVVERVDDVFRTIDWLDGFLAFESTPLLDVAEEFNRRLGFEFDIAHPSLFDRTVTGWFSDQPHDEIISAVCIAVGADCTIDGFHVLMELASEESVGSMLEGATD